ncbi:hypothetical protein EW145_g6553 [Phellinidium pouzarii]|uniref:Uncharacterized protein n=1 Tax=Phellinidium pouzarii TaxID=167371 RepID=A0A4S4KY22_9AGAM|nr:hypothetical protein EW145_g6553 [Phellinidium pouzarii]
MVDVTFKARCAHAVPLALIKRIAGAGAAPPEDVAYIGEDNVRALKDAVRSRSFRLYRRILCLPAHICMRMALVNRSRLSVQPVEEGAWTTVQLLAAKGGFVEEAASTTVKNTGRSKGKFEVKSKAVNEMDARKATSSKTKTEDRMPHARTKAKAEKAEDASDDADLGSESRDDKRGSGVGTTDASRAQDHALTRPDEKEAETPQKKRKAKVLNDKEGKDNESQGGRAIKKSSRARK